MCFNNNIFLNIYVFTLLFLYRKHPQHIIDYSFTKIFQPKFQTENNDNITFIRTYNPSHNINLKKFHSCIDKIKNKELKTCFQKKKVLLSTREPPNLHNVLLQQNFKDYQYQNKLIFFLSRTASIIKMFILKNVYLFRSHP